MVWIFHSVLFYYSSVSYAAQEIINRPNGMEKVCSLNVNKVQQNTSTSQNQNCKMGKDLNTEMGRISFFGRKHDLSSTHI